jgi:hypothetical protein
LWGLPDGETILSQRSGTSLASAALGLAETARGGTAIVTVAPLSLALSLSFFLALAYSVAALSHTHTHTHTYIRAHTLTHTHTTTHQKKTCRTRLWGVQSLLSQEDAPSGSPPSLSRSPSLPRSLALARSLSLSLSRSLALSSSPIPSRHTPSGSRDQMGYVDGVCKCGVGPCRDSRRETRRGQARS